MIEVFTDKRLLREVRTEINNAKAHNIVRDEDVEKLLGIPLLQSICSELLRLRVEVQTIFSSDKEEIQINEWRIPKGSLIVVPAGGAHRDPDFWNTRNGRYPLDRFWAQRFLSYPGDPDSGPLNPSVRPQPWRPAGKKVQGDGKPKYVATGLTDSYIPFGIGERTCPGRGFARREIISFCALVVDRYDIEFAKDQEFESGSTFYGIGTQRPRGRIPFKIRTRRRDENVAQFSEADSQKQRDF